MDADEIRRVLNILNISAREQDSYFGKFSCPLHRDERPSALVYKNSGMFVCFSSCGTMHISRLYKNITNGQSVYKDLNIDNNRTHTETDKLKTRRKAKIPDLSKTVIDIRGPLADIYSNDEAVAYCKKRKITKEFIKKFELKYSKFTTINSTIFEHRIVFPIYEKSCVISVEGRSINPEKIKPKTLYPKGASPSTLFNYDNLNFEEPLIIVEGVMDIPKIWSKITKNVTTTFGNTINARQKELIKKFKNIILFPDGDKGGQDFVKNVHKFYEQKFRVACIDGFDPGHELVTFKKIQKAIDSVLLN